MALDGSYSARRDEGAGMSTQAAGGRFAVDLADVHGHLLAEPLGRGPVLHERGEAVDAGVLVLPDLLQSGGRGDVGAD
jgi:hypothetical protein